MTLAGFALLPQCSHPIIHESAIKTTIEKAAFELNILSPQTRALTLCIIAFSSLISFDETVLGPGPRPQSFLDTQFFLSDTDVRSCGARRAGVCRALHLEAINAALDAKVMLELSEENTASCFILCYLEQYKFCGPTRPWGSAFYSHLRSIAPTWKVSEAGRNGRHWNGFLMAEALIATKYRSPYPARSAPPLWAGAMFPANSPRLFGKERSTPTRFRVAFLYGAIHISRYMFCSPTSRNDNWRYMGGLDFMRSLCIMRTILSLLFEQACAAVLNYLPSTSTVLNGVGALSVDTTMPSHKCVRSDRRHQNTHERLLLLRNQARSMALLGACSLAKGLGYLPLLMYHTHTHWHFPAAWAEFCLEEADTSLVEDIHALEVIAAALNEVGYSVDLSQLSRRINTPIVLHVCLL
ncbi:hypothetical protein C8J57DRAFT_1510065 [Mycena rebaudengoi]|nr:hypothetical protein C8J57DRAFT_1510065 [Mycena rebaudengoi]